MSQRNFGHDEVTMGIDGSATVNYRGHTVQIPPDHFRRTDHGIAVADKKLTDVFRKIDAKTGGGRPERTFRPSVGRRR